MTSLTARLVGIVILGVAFIALTLVVTAGFLNGLDLQIARTMHDLWQPSLHPLFQVIAELGGLEMTTILIVGLTYYLWRAGFGTDALVFVVFIAAQGFELYYKLTLHHPQPPRSLAEGDGPSLTELFSASGAGNSFPSGHMLRAVIAYGLIAFVIRRLSPSPVVRAVAAGVALGIVLLIAVDRLYLNEHWGSDVIGGIVLGAIGLLAGTVWLDRPRPRKSGE